MSPRLDKQNNIKMNGKSVEFIEKTSHCKTRAINTTDGGDRWHFSYKKSVVDRSDGLTENELTFWGTGYWNVTNPRVNSRFAPDPETIFTQTPCVCGHPTIISLQLNYEFLRMDLCVM